MRLTLLGPQRYHPAVGRAVRDLRIAGDIATVNAGWQERESDDAELDGLLGGRSRNLHLFDRWIDVTERDPEFAAADTQRRQTIEEIQAVYLLRLHHAMVSIAELQARTGDPAVLAGAVDDAIDAVARLDAWHLERVAEVHAAFYDRWPPHERSAVAEHRAAVARLLDGVAGVAIAGGHVGVLLHVLHLFNVGPLLEDRPVVAWSAGAMAVTETVVLFHDHAVHGSRQAEVLDRGLGLVRGIVALPHARRRLTLSDADRMSRLARRFAPARCLVLDDGAEVRLGPDGSLPHGCTVLDGDGMVRTYDAA
jgi:hypothetical protein